MKTSNGTPTPTPKAKPVLKKREPVKWSEKYKSVGINREIFKDAEELIDRAWPSAKASSINSKILLLVYHAMDDLEHNVRENIAYPTRAKVRIGN